MWFMDKSAKLQMPTPETALAGRTTPMPVPERHAVLGSSMAGPWPGMELAMFGMGCFWGAEKMFWKEPGVVNTAVGYAAGLTPNPTYREVCSGQTGHNEVVRVVFDPNITTFEQMVRTFLENHDPTQGMRQGNDVGTQYRSGIYVYSPAQRALARSLVDAFGGALKERGYGAITTELLDAPPFYFAEDYHQQYLHKNPDGYCGIGGTGVSCPAGVGKLTA